MTRLSDLIAEEFGYDDPVDAIQSEGWIFDSVVPGICRSCKHVEYNCEPDARENHCHQCGESKVVSILGLLDLI